MLQSTLLLLQTLVNPLMASTVTGTTFQLKDPGNNVISASVNTSSAQITLTPSAALANATTYTVTIKGGASGVKDLAGNALANDYNWSFTTLSGTGGGATYSVFPITATPAEPLNNDGQGIALGMKIRSTQSGLITGVRYYKGAGTTGTHTGAFMEQYRHIDGISNIFRRDSIWLAANIVCDPCCH